jgi:serine/threonine-protein kinase
MVGPGGVTGGSASNELVRTSQLYLEVLAAAWIAIALVTAPFHLAAGWSAIALQVIGLALILIARFSVLRRGVSPRAAAVVAMAVGGTTLAISAAIAAGEQAGAGLLGFAAGVPALAAALASALVHSHRHWQLRHQLYESRRLDRYRLMLPIGHGGMNDVWLAWDETRRREVALKLLRTQGTPAATRARFAREAEINRLVRSPHTVRIDDFGVSEDGFAYIALEYLRGMDLDELVAAFGPLGPRRAVHLMRQACEGLGAAHRCGVVHRDIKPANLHCTDERGAEDLLRILDFGVARRLDLEESLDDGVIGTPAYMPPEAFRRDPVTPASDVYALGATFYFALTGVPPVDADSPAGFGRAHELAPIVPPSLRSGVDLPRPIEKVILRCLAKKPGDRFADAAELGAVLDEAAHELEPWTRDDAARWWQHARLGTGRMRARHPEHTTDVEAPRERRSRATLRR